MDEEKSPLEEEKEAEEPKPADAEEPKEEAHKEELPEIKPEETESKPKKRRCGFWKSLAIILFILLIISIFTHGFRFGGITGEAVLETKTEKVSVTVLSDARCKECDTTNLVAQLRTLFPDLEITELDYNDEQGKALYDELDIKYLPAVLFDKSVENTDEYEKIKMYLIPAGDFLSLRIGADFDPEAEICDNGIDDTGNDLIDCEDPDCENSMLCRKEIKKDLQLFVMSQCPFGTKALDAMKDVLEAFEDDNLRFDVHYIASETQDKTFSSLHGQPEIDENIRQLCAKKYYEANYKYMDYIWCRNKNIMSEEWEDCAEENGMSVAKLKACSEGDEGKELLSEDIKVAQELNIMASPTWLANNRYSFGGIDAETVKENICKHNPGLKGCSKTLSTAQGVQGQC